MNHDKYLSGLMIIMIQDWWHSWAYGSERQRM